MPETYTYLLSRFDGGNIDITQFNLEIDNSVEIQKSLTSIANRNSIISIVFSDDLTNAEEDSLTYLVDNYAYIPFPEKISYSESVDNSSTTSTNWQQKVSITFTVHKNIPYLFQWSAEVSTESKNTKIKVKVETDENDTFSDIQWAPKTDKVENYAPYMGFKQFTFTTYGYKTITLSFASEKNKKHVNIRNAKILIRNVEY